MEEVSVQQQTSVLAEHTYRLLMKLIEKKKIPKINTKVACQLIVRESTVRDKQGGAA